MRINFSSLVSKVIISVTLLCLVIVMGGCGKDKEAKQENSGYSVVDSEGVTVKMAAKPMRILSQSLAFDTMLLGLVTPDRLVSCNILGGDTESSFIVEETKNIPTKLKSFVPISTDLVLSLKPDLIVLPATAKPEMVATFRDLGYPVLVCKNSTNIEDIKSNITLLAKATGEEAAGKKVIAQMEKELASIETTLAKQQLSDKQPVGLLVSQMTSYGGKNSIFDVICTQARVTNGIAMVGLNNGEKLTKELVVKADPDFFMVSAPKADDRYNAQQYRNEFLNDPAYKGMKALNNIVEIPNRYLYTNSQNIVYAIKGVANYAYGNIFDMSNEKLIKGY